MNLIEQLGGYYQAKNWLDKNEIHVKHGYLEKYRGELLEYRRQHNIFEIGDLYVFTEKYSKHSVIHKVDSLNSGKGCIRHATDEEIKAGCRL